MRLEEPFYIFEIEPKKKCLEVSQVPALVTKADLLWYRFPQRTTIFTNNNEGDTRRKYIAMVEKQSAWYLRLTSIKKRSNSPDTRCREALIVPWQAAVARRVSGFVAKCFLCARQRLFIVDRF